MGEVTNLVVDTTVHNLDSIFRSCYVFTDRCYLFLQRRGEQEIVVEFRSKNTEVALREVIGAFANELINQRVRSDVARETRTIREQIVAQAFAEADFGDSTSQNR